MEEEGSWIKKGTELHGHLCFWKSCVGGVPLWSSFSRGFLSILAVLFPPLPWEWILWYYRPHLYIMDQAILLLGCTMEFGETAEISRNCLRKNGYVRKVIYWIGYLTDSLYPFFLLMVSTILLVSREIWLICRTFWDTGKHEDGSYDGMEGIG